MNPMMQMLAQQRIADMHQAATTDRLGREAKAARADRGDRVASTRRWRRTAQTVCAT